MVLYFYFLYMCAMDWCDIRVPDENIFFIAWVIFTMAIAFAFPLAVAPLFVKIFYLGVNLYTALFGFVLLTSYLNLLRNSVQMFIGQTIYIITSAGLIYFGFLFL
jgi:hypothetical protein